MKALICITFVMLPFFAFADSYYIQDVRGDSSQTSVTFKELIRGELRAQRQTVVNSPDRSQWSLEPSLLKLGDEYIFSLSKISNGRVVHSQKLKSSSVSDLDDVTERLVKSLVKNQSVDLVTTGQTEDLSVVSTAEKTDVEKQFYFGFGPGALSGLNANGGAVSVTAGYLWGLDSNFGLRLGFDWTGASGDADVLNVGLGGQYYLNLQKHAPYVLGLLGFSWSESEALNPAQCTNIPFSCGGDDKLGWSSQLGGGVHFFRSSKVNLALEVAYTINFYQVANSTPGVFTGRILLYW
jgi:hypothetical protein